MASAAPQSHPQRRKQLRIEHYFNLREGCKQFIIGELSLSHDLSWAPLCRPDHPFKNSSPPWGLGYVKHPLHAKSSKVSLDVLVAQNSLDCLKHLPVIRDHMTGEPSSGCKSLETAEESRGRHKIYSHHTTCVQTNPDLPLSSIGASHVQWPCKIHSCDGERRCFLNSVVR